MYNIFDLELPDFKSILENKSCVDYIYLTLDRYLSSMGIKSEEIENTKIMILNAAMSYTDLNSYEKEIHSILRNSTSDSILKNCLVDRAKRVTGQVLPHLKYGNVFDNGCGDGLIGKFINEKDYSVYLSDVYEHPDIKFMPLDFKLMDENDKLPYDDNNFDNSLLITVLHHSNAPFFTLEETVRVTKNGGRIIVIESVYSVNEHDAQNCEMNDYLSAFLNLNSDEQLRVNMFFDHFYNRCFHYSDDPLKKVNVPFNYRTPDEWKNIFEEYGLKEINRIGLGIDQPLAPLFHTLHIVEKKY